MAENVLPRDDWRNHVVTSEREENYFDSGLKSDKEMLRELSL